MGRVIPGHETHDERMAYRKKTWIEKLHEEKKGLPKVVRIKGRQEKIRGKGTMAIATPWIVDEIMRSVPKGKVITINRIRERIAKKFKATIGCPITTGIFSWIAAYAAEEMRSQGKKRITPWWRTLKGTGFLNEKYPGGAENQKKLLIKEGHKIRQAGKRFYVEDITETQVA
jgi:alkylated DNA nucleotide flippase Atl1